MAPRECPVLAYPQHVNTRGDGGQQASDTGGTAPRRAPVAPETGRGRGHDRLRVGLRRLRFAGVFWSFDTRSRL